MATCLQLTLEPPHETCQHSSLDPIADSVPLFSALVAGDRNPVSWLFRFPGLGMVRIVEHRGDNSAATLLAVVLFLHQRLGSIFNRLGVHVSRPGAVYVRGYPLNPSEVGVHRIAVPADQRQLPILRR